MATEKDCEQVLAKHEVALFNRPGVVGLGIVSADESMPGSDQLAVAVYVQTKLPLEDLAEEHVIPETLELELPGGSREVPVRVIEQGPVELEEFGFE